MKILQLINLINYHYQRKNIEKMGKVINLFIKIVNNLTTYIFLPLVIDNTNSGLVDALESYMNRPY